MISIRDNNLNIPYIFSDHFHIDMISKFLINTMVNMRLNMLTTFNEELASSIKKIKSPFYFKKDIRKPYFISKKFEFITELNFQDGDGDCAFY